MTEQEASQSGADRPPILKLVNVVVGDLHDPQNVILEQVNWSVAAGDYWVVGGLHASGKTNLMATLSGIMPPLHGEYHIFGEHVATASDQERAMVWRRLGIVFDGGRLLHRLTIAENV